MTAELSYEGWLRRPIAHREPRRSPFVRMGESLNEVLRRIVSPSYPTSDGKPSEYGVINYRDGQLTPEQQARAAALEALAREIQKAGG